MIRLFTLLLLLLAAPLAAQDWPKSYFVTDVAEDDTLNIRRDPDPSSEVIGEYGPFRLNIEVLETTQDGTWGQVGSGEGMGWVSMAFLTETLPVEAGTIPRPMQCSGTEPFWSLSMQPSGDEYHLLGEEVRQMTMTGEQSARDGYLATFSEGPRTHRTLIVKRLSCTDGMSDRNFGFRATLFNAQNGDNNVQIGCCTLDSGN